jgi:hypothetical protein
MTAGDVAAAKQRFTQGGETLLTFNITAVIPGSDSMGVTAMNGEKISTEFKVFILDETVSGACADN